MPIITLQTQVFGLVSAISCSFPSGRSPWGLYIWHSSSLWLGISSLVLFLTLHCMFPIVVLIREQSFFLLIHYFSLLVTWILWLAAAAAFTESVGGSLNCSVQTKFVYCGQLNALEGFAWLIWFAFSPFTLSQHSKFTIIQGSDDLHAHLRSYPRYYSRKTRRRSGYSYGRSLSSNQETESFFSFSCSNKNPYVVSFQMMNIIQSIQYYVSEQAVRHLSDQICIKLSPAHVRPGESFIKPAKNLILTLP